MITRKYGAGVNTVAVKQGNHTMTTDLMKLKKREANHVLKKVAKYRERGYKGYLK